MGVECRSQVLVCPFPAHVDTYSGCSHGCRYCFARRKRDIANVEPLNCLTQVRRFIAGGRTNSTNWCDWAIPLHWGGMSDPFQPAEREHRVSLRMLELFAETGYPFIVSTKGSLAAEEPYLSLLGHCNAVVQVSMVCPSYDRLEPGAPTFRERLGMLRRLSAVCKRTIVRVQPYLPEVRRELLDIIPSLREAGAHSLTVEGMKHIKRKPGLVRVGGDYVFPDEVLRRHYESIRDRCHDVGLGFLCAENRLRAMGDSMHCCCGELEGFRGNDFNLVSLKSGCATAPSPAMLAPATAHCFIGANQSVAHWRKVRDVSFADAMMGEARKYAN